ncbi:Uncharacterized protein PBTT_09004 [Plasmodiophora brassicae]
MAAGTARESVSMIDEDLTEVTARLDALQPVVESGDEDQSVYEYPGEQSGLPDGNSAVDAARIASIAKVDKAAKAPELRLCDDKSINKWFDALKRHTEYLNRLGVLRSRAPLREMIDEDLLPVLLRSAGEPHWTSEDVPDDVIERMLRGWQMAQAPAQSGSYWTYFDSLRMNKSIQARVLDYGRQLVKIVKDGNLGEIFSGEKGLKKKVDILMQGIYP